LEVKTLIFLNQQPAYTNIASPFKIMGEICRIAINYLSRNSTTTALRWQSGEKAVFYSTICFSQIGIKDANTKVNTLSNDSILRVSLIVAIHVCSLKKEKSLV